MASGGVSLVHPDVLTIGGAMETKKLGDMCNKYGVAMAIHMAEKSDWLYGGSSLCCCGT